MVADGGEENRLETRHHPLSLATIMTAREREVPMKIPRSSVAALIAHSVERPLLDATTSASHGAGAPAAEHMH